MSVKSSWVFIQHIPTEILDLFLEIKEQEVGRPHYDAAQGRKTWTSQSQLIIKKKKKKKKNLGIATLFRNSWSKVVPKTDC